MGDLAADEVHEVLEGLNEDTEGKSTEELLKIGEILVNANIDRATQLDTKATSILGYGGVIAAFLITQPDWVGQLSSLERWFAVPAALAAGFSCILSFAVVFPVTWKWFSDEDWFNPEVVADAGVLSRYHVKVMHEIVGQHDGKLKIKANYLIGAQAALMIAVMLLVMILVSKLV